MTTIPTIPGRNLLAYPKYQADWPGWKIVDDLKAAHVRVCLKDSMPANGFGQAILRGLMDVVQDGRVP